MATYPKKLKDNKTFRVFFSSPFGGMEDEREELTRRYFPEFSHICNERGVQFVGVDMRWGITSEASASGQVINICLRELDRSDLFVGFFGQRYGWHGEDDAALQENFDNAVGRYPWVDKVRDKSVTELEFLHGHLNHPGALPSFICFRDKAYDDKVRDEAEKEGDKKKVFKYSSESEQATRLMDDLKQRVMDTKDKTLGVLINYKTPKEAAQKIYEAILNHLKNYLLLNEMEEVKPTARSLSLTQHDSFLTSRTKLYEGYKDFISQLNKNLDLENPQHILVIGEAGCGKSALLCNWINQLKPRSDCCVVYHFIGYAQDSTSMSSILTRLVDEFEFVVCGLKGLEEKKSDSTDDIRELMRRLIVAMEALLALGKQPVIVLDGLSKVQKPGSGLEKPLYFLPVSLPPKGVLVTSTKLEDKENIEELRDTRGYRVIQLTPLDTETKRSICVKTLKEAGKELSQNQLERIIQDKQTESPLFLKITLNELVMFGYFRLLDKKIDSLISSQSVDELFEKVLQRLEDDYNDKETQNNLVEKVMCCICLSNHGMSENEIKEMFDIDAQSWSPLYFAVESYLIEQAGHMVLGFSELKESILKKYLQNEQNRKLYLQKMVTYFESKRQKSIDILDNNTFQLSPVTRRSSSELPFLLRSLGEFEHLAKLLVDPLWFSCQVSSDWDLYQVISFWRSINLPWFEVAKRYKESVLQLITDCYIFLEEVNQLDTRSPGLIVGQTLTNLCHMFKLTSDYQSMELLYKMHLSIMEENLESGKLTDVSEVDSVKYDLACFYVDYSQYDEAEKLHLEAFQHRKQVYEELGDVTAPADVKTILGNSYHGIGLIYYYKEEYDKAEEFIRESMKIVEGIDKASDRSSALSNLSSIAMRKGEYDLALKYAKESLQILEDLNYGHVPPIVGNMLNNIGLIYRRMGDIEAAETHYKRALEIKKRALGEFHTDVPISLMNLGVVEQIRGNFDKSLEYYEEGINIYKVCRVPENSDPYLKMQENRLFMMWRMEKFDDVLKEYFSFFDVVERENRVDYCLGFFMTDIVKYLITQESYEQALKLTLALVNSKLIDAVNIVHLDYLDTVMWSEDERPKRREELTLDAALNRWPSSGDLLRQKLTRYSLPQRDIQAVVQLLDSFHANTEYGIDVYDFGLQLLDSEKVDQDMLLAISEAGLAKYPDSLPFLKNVASTRRAQKQHDLAVTTLKKIIELDPSDSISMMQLIQSTALSNDIDLSRQYCQVAKERFGDNEEIMKDVDNMLSLLQEAEEQMNQQNVEETNVKQEN